jgi:hypothetical protein
MNSAEMLWSFGDLCDAGISAVYDNVGNMMNYAVIVLGFIGLFIWLAKQAKFNKEAEGNADQLK